MTRQLDLFTLTKPTPTTARKAAAAMIAHLHVDGGWLTRRELMDRFGLKDSRVLRAGREASNGRILAGQRGYKLTRCATGEEIRVSLALKAAQIRAEQEDYRKLAARAHGIIAGKTD